MNLCPLKIVCIISLGLCLEGAALAKTKGKPAKVNKTATKNPPKSPANVFHRFELRTAPLAFIAKWYSLEAMVRVHQNWGFGPSVVFYDSSPIGNMFLPSLKGRSYGLNANYYFQGAQFDSWYLGLKLFQDSYFSYPHGIDRRDQFRGMRVIPILGHQFKKWGRVNFLMGLGPSLGRYKFRQGDLAERQRWLVGPYIEFKVGLEF